MQILTSTRLEAVPDGSDAALAAPNFTAKLSVPGGRPGDSERLAAALAASSNTLSVRRAADREQMAAELVTLIRSLPHGATCTEELRGPRELVVRIDTPCGALACVDFDGATVQPDLWVVTWNTRKRMASSMGAVNPHHGAKLTRVFYSFPALLGGLAHDIALFADGSAYASPEATSAYLRAAPPPYPLG